jgi:hypothetical protein
MITKKMVNNYLSEDYHEWITNVITDICNDPSEINILKKEITEDWKEHLKNSKD